MKYEDVVEFGKTEYQDLKEETIKEDMKVLGWTREQAEKDWNENEDTEEEYIQKNYDDLEAKLYDERKEAAAEFQWECVNER